MQISYFNSPFQQISENHDQTANSLLTGPNAYKLCKNLCRLPACAFTTPVD